MAMNYPVRSLGFVPMYLSLFLLAACTGNVRHEVASAPIHPTVSLPTAPLATPSTAPTAPEGGLLGKGEAQVHDIPDLAWDIAEQNAAFSLARQAGGEFIGGIMRHAQEKPVRTGEDNGGLITFLEDWRAKVALERVKVPNLSYERLFSYDRLYTDLKGREMAEVYVQANSKQVKLMRMSWARLLYKDALAGGVLKNAEKDFWRTLKQIAESPQLSDIPGGGKGSPEGRTP